MPQTLRPVTGGCAAADWSEHEDRDLAVGLELVVGMVREHVHSPAPPDGLLVPEHLARPVFLVQSAVVRLDDRLGDQAGVPLQVGWLATVGRDNHVAPVVAQDSRSCPQPQSRTPGSGNIGESPAKGHQVNGDLRCRSAGWRSWGVRAERHLGGMSHVAMCAGSRTPALVGPRPEPSTCVVCPTGSSRLSLLSRARSVSGLQGQGRANAAGLWPHTSWSAAPSGSAGNAPVEFDGRTR
jgi:hypothetical protein